MSAAGAAPAGGAGAGGAGADGARAAGAAPARLPETVAGFRTPLLWGVALLVAIEATVLSLFVTSYFYLRLGVPEWPPPGVAPPELLLPSVGTALILASPLPAWWGLRRLGRGRRWPLLISLPLGGGLAAGYLALKGVELADKEYSWTAHAYGSLDWSMNGYAALHVVALLLFAATVWVLALRGHLHADRLAGAQALILYWVFVALGSVLFYVTQYLTPWL